MEKQKSIPHLRFPEYREDWEKNKIGKLFNIIAGGDIPTENVRSIRNELFKYPIYANAEKEKGLYAYSNIYRIDKEVVTIAGRGVNMGIAHARKEKFYPIVRLLVLEPVNKSSVEFFEYVLNHLNFYVESTGVPQLTVPQISTYLITYPSLPEQQKIASFFTAIDQKISQLKQKKTLLELYKKGVMQKIFSQEIRFKDDNGQEFPKWGKKRLDDVISKFIVPMRDKPKDLTGDIPWCRIEDFNGKYLFESRTNQGVSKETIRKMNLKVYPVNTLIVSCSANLGFCAIVKKELVTNQTFIGLVPKADENNVEFLFYVMVLSARKLNSLSSGTTISYLSREQFEKFNIKIPFISEQTKIANFLSAIDDKINHTQTQIDKAEVWKKGLMQQMFV